MYQFLTLIGPGAFSFVIIQCLMKDKELSFINGLAQIITLSMINYVITVLTLINLSKNVIILNEDGTSYIQYGPVDAIFSMFVAVLLSLIVVVIKKYVAVRVKVEGEDE